MKKRSIIIAIIVIVFVFLGEVHGKTKPTVIEKENSRIKIEISNDKILNGYRLLNSPKENDAYNQLVYVDSLVYTIKNSAYFNQYHKKVDGEWVMDVDAVLEDFKSENIITISTNGDMTQLWALTARLLEVCREINYRLGVGNNDIDDLELYKQLTAPVVSTTKCPDGGVAGDDPLYYLGCGGGITVRSLILSALTGINGKDAKKNEKMCNESKSGEEFAKKMGYETDKRLVAAYKVLKYANDLNKLTLDAITEYNNKLKEEVSSDEKVPNYDVNAPNKGWWESAQNFFNKNQAGKKLDTTNGILVELDDMIFNIGNMIFIIVTSLLGVKYIFGAAEGKAQVKDSLITLIVAALFFYGWSTIYNLLDIGGLLATGGYETTASKIYNTVLFIVNLLAICGIIWIGVKYMLSSAQGRSEIKTSWGPLILGIVMVYGTIWFLTTVINVILN